MPPTIGWPMPSRSEGATADALETLARLQRDWPRSEWRDDAEALRVELLRAGGQEPHESDISDEELKIMALAGLAQSDPQRAMPLVEKILRGNSSEDLKEQALFIAGQMGGSDGIDLLVQFARDNDQSDLQESAIQYLAVVGGEDHLPMLVELYEEDVGRSAKEAILSAFLIAGDKERLLTVARNESDVDLRAEAIHLLGSQGAAEELWQLYQGESSVEIQEAVLEGLMISGESGRLREVARDEKATEEIREMAIQLLGVQGDHEALLEIFGSATSTELKTTIVQSLGIAGRGEDLLVIIRNGSHPLEVREEAVVCTGHPWRIRVVVAALAGGRRGSLRGDCHRIGPSGKGDQLLALVGDSSRSMEMREHAMESMMLVGPEPEELSKLYSSLSERELKEAVLQVMLASNAAEALVAIVNTETDRELRAEAVQYLSLTGSPLAADVLEAILEE